MAAGELPRPGSSYGPCLDEGCGHLDCAETRRMAAAECRICEGAIDYGRRFYRTDPEDLEGDGTVLVDASGREYVLVHEACFDIAEGI